MKVYSSGCPNSSRINLISFVFTGFLLLCSSRQAYAQTTPKQTTEQYIPEEKSDNIQRAKPATVTIIGTVTSREDGQAMTGVKVMLKGTSIETSTDTEGKFTLDLPNKDSSQFIVFSFKGFKSVEYMHNVTRPGREIADMTRHTVSNVPEVLVGILGGAVVSTWHEPKKNARDIWWWLRGR